MRVLWAVGVTLLAAAAPEGLRLLERNHPKVAEGIAAYDRQDFDAALKAFDAAKAELPDNPTVELNRGNALFRMGRLDEAKEAFAKAANDYNLGTTLAHEGKRDEAIAALRRALVKDPNDEDARHNLEVLLRQLKPPQPDGGPDGGSDGGQDSGQPDAGKPADGGQDGGRDAGEPDGGSDGGSGDGGADAGRDGGPGDGGQGNGSGADAGGDAGQDGGQDGGRAGPSEGQDGGQAATSSEALDGGADGGIAGVEAQRMLDAMRQNERNLQMWRFQQKKRTKNPHEKDW